jgi:hypothetical protein
MRILIAFTACLALVACGGGGYRKAARDVGHTAAAPGTGPSGAPKVMRLASGPISKACLASDRKARSRETCGCIQAVANDTLNTTDQRLAASFYSDPHSAQVVRQSDRISNERFWKTYKSYAETAAAACG